MELAFGQRLTERDLADPAWLRRTEAAMLQGMEHRRRYEEWASGKRYWLLHQGFNRIDDDVGPVLECRAALMEGPPAHSVAFRSPDGYAVPWTGSEADRERIGKDLPEPVVLG
jgi:hypothetical protein